eukprot:6214313-Pleurochrysis_carterae.AAC.1
MQCSHTHRVPSMNSSTSIWMLAPRDPRADHAVCDAPLRVEDAQPLNSELIFGVSFTDACSESICIRYRADVRVLSYEAC